MSSIYSLLYSSQIPSSNTTNSGSATSSTSASSPTLSGSSSLGGLSAPTSSDSRSWYEAMAKAWGQALNQQAQVITQLSDEVSNAGQDQPSQITQLTAESMRFSYLATNASTATTSVGEALETLGRKQ
jgi:hypothetical protein